MTRTWLVVIAALSAVGAQGCKKEHKADGKVVIVDATVPSAPPVGSGTDLKGSVATTGDGGTVTVDIPSTPAEPFEAPTTAECDAAIQNAFNMMVAETTKDAKPAESAKLKLAMKEQFAQQKGEAMTNCMKTPKKLVQCTANAKSIDDFRNCQGVKKPPDHGAPQKPDWSKYGGPKATEADCKGLGKTVEAIFDKDPQLAKLPPEQRTQLKQSLKTVDSDCVGMPKVALECFRKADSLQALSACGQVVAPAPGGPPGGPPAGAAPGGADPHAGHGH